MSILVQARLAPLSHRYLTLLSYRHDICDKIVLTNLNTSYIFARPDNDLNHAKSLNSQFKSHQFKDCHKSILRDTPNLMHCDHQKLLERQLEYALNEKRLTPMVPSGLQNLKLNEMSNKRQYYLNMNQSQQQPCKFKKYLLSLRKRHQDLVNKFPRQLNNFFRRNDRALNLWSQTRGKDGKSYESYNDSSTPLVVMLGILGLFQKADTSDLESEKAVLNDAKKIEKMKPIELKIAKGILSMCDHDYARASALFHEALRIAQDEQDELQEVKILNLIAANYFEGGSYEEAEKLFIDLMKRMIANEVPPTDPAILELSLKLASIYSKNLATHEKALKGFKFVIHNLLEYLDDVLSNFDEIDIKELSEDKRNAIALLGWSYDWFAKYLLVINDYSSAANLLEEALKISWKILGSHHDQTLILLNDIGTTLAMNNAPEEGKTFIERAVEGAITSQSDELASFYVNLGLVNLTLRNFNEAIRYCEYSKELASKNRDHYNSHEVDELSRTCLDDVKRQFETERQ